MAKELMVELMLLYGRISLDRAEELIGEHYDIVEAAWLDEVQLEGAFACGVPVVDLEGVLMV